MPPDPIPLGSPEDWLRYAKADLVFARAPLPQGGLYEILCFHAQQVAEKSVKAVLIQRGVEFPKTHILERLVDLLPADIVRTPELLQSARLTIYATTSRYPGDIETVSEEEHQEAVGLAEAIVSWAEGMISSKSEGC
jgi:HEPN domain-containing protein